MRPLQVRVFCIRRNMGFIDTENKSHCDVGICRDQEHLTREFHLFNSDFTTFRTVRPRGQNLSRLSLSSETRSTLKFQINLAPFDQGSLG